ncbi:PREDICTED: oral cancer-overexpressed protein 1 isoform X1 [Condylura cristata]|uniref:oral cancer-overexpressed protein 1 isoform X1 n=1 Tax=Condylura cristata TaxID=143302 RepID=UPI00064366B7|nr:PREDICTED: oral cancer-overexpressed protein 1 isoform X1 [Condylura cristata]
MAGSRDMFDSIVMADERFHGDGFREGYEEGSSLGLTEGRRHGALHGAKVGSEAPTFNLLTPAGTKGILPLSCLQDWKKTPSWTVRSPQDPPTARAPRLPGSPRVPQPPRRQTAPLHTADRGRLSPRTESALQWNASRVGQKRRERSCGLHGRGGRFWG